MKKITLFITSFLVIITTSCTQNITGYFSHNSSKKAMFYKNHHDKKTKNIIIFIGDGMGISTVTAGRIFVGQAHGQTGEEYNLSIDKFPHTALVKTYNTNSQVPDSAGTASAIMTGKKTNIGFLSINPKIKYGQCGASYSTIIDRVQKAHMKTGVITTTRITHATPASTYAHTSNRDWEADNDIKLKKNQTTNCTSIAAQLVNRQQPPDLIMGGGRKKFTQQQLAKYVDKNNASYISNATQLLKLNNNKKVLGLFSPSHMTYMANRKKDTTQPTLSQMTKASIKYLQKSNQGYFLLVEGGRIDHAHHQSKAGLALNEFAEFEKSINMALGMTDQNDTLILVTADHSHVFTMAGYPVRGNPILGLVKSINENGEKESKPTLADDHVPYTTLGYGNGPNAHHDPKAPRKTPRTDINATYQAGIFKHSETHSGEDVPLYAMGQNSALVHGVIEQNKIFDIMIDAYGLD